MKKMVLSAAASLFGIGLLAAPAMAQPQIQFGIGPDGRPQIGVRDPEQERYERRERWRQRREDDRARAYEEGRRDAERERRFGAYSERCRTVVIREENEWGRMETRRIQRCG